MEDPVDIQVNVEETSRAPRERTKRALRAFERVLFVLGALAVITYVSACAHRDYFQRGEEKVFEASIAQLMIDEEYDQSEWSGKRVEAFGHTLTSPPSAATLGRLDIPAAGVSVMVLDGTDDWTLDRAVGRIEDTARPGEPGNFGIAGHRDSFFRGLRHLAVGDALSFANADGVARYEVAALDIVAPETVDVLDPTDEPTITLVTCYPFYFVGAAPQRFIVRATQVGFDAWTPERLAEFANVPKAFAAHR